MSASLTKKYLRTVEERDTALRQNRELQAQLVAAQQQLAAIAVRDTEAAKTAAATHAKVTQLTEDLAAASRANTELAAKLATIEERRKAALAERTARKQASAE